MRKTITVVSLSLALVIGAACGSSKPTEQGPASRTPTARSSQPNSSPLPQDAQEITLNPADFVSEIDNPYWPIKPGSRWVYSETDAEGTVKRVDITVTSDTKMILGIRAVVVHDVVTQGGQLVEDTLDWYAQDRSGNIWYLGEDTKEYENGKVVSTKGSWEAGVDGAQAGVVVPANPTVGTVYREEYLKGEAEDSAQVLSLDELVQVPFGSFDNVLMTKNYTPLEPTLLEHKFYAKGIGQVMGITVSGGTDREELIEYQQG